jgi:trans-2,3-dihydro-3-hydroxyanthranilate isomerase
VRRRFVTLDVFTSRRFVGNPLAVVLEPEGLGDATMQAIAREFNLAETVFVLPPSLPAFRAALRIFTPRTELPFAGHPTIGTAVLLARLDGTSGARDLVLEEGIGPVSCTAEVLDGERGRGSFMLEREPEHVGEAEDAAALAAALGLTLDDLGCEAFVPGHWSAGVPCTFVPVRGLDVIERSRPDPARWDDTFGPDDPAIVYVFCRQTVEAGHAFHARMFAPRLGVPEDPATGSAAAAFAGLVARYGQLRDGDHRLTIEQGYEMGRPSLIELSLSLQGGKLVGASIGGEAILVSEGTIEA